MIGGNIPLTVDILDSLWKERELSNKVFDVEGVFTKGKFNKYCWISNDKYTMPDPHKGITIIEKGFFLLTYTTPFVDTKYFYHLFNKYVLYRHKGIGHEGLDIHDYVIDIKKEKEVEKLHYQTKNEIKYKWNDPVINITINESIPAGASYDYSHVKKGWIYKYKKNNIDYIYKKKLFHPFTND